MPGDNGWDESKQLVLHELERHSNWLGDITNVQREILKEISALKVKSTVWGVIGGAISAVGAALIGLVVWLIKE